MVKTLKDLREVIKLCNKYGIESIKLDGTEINFVPHTIAPLKQTITLPVPPPYPYNPGQGETPVITPDQPTEEELLFWSTGVRN